MSPYTALFGIAAGIVIGVLLTWVLMSNVNHRLSREVEALNGKLVEHRLIADRHKGEIERIHKACDLDVAYWENEACDARNKLDAARRRFDQPRDPKTKRFVRREVPAGARERLMEEIAKEPKA